MAGPPNMATANVIVGQAAVLLAAARPTRVSITLISRMPVDTRYASTGSIAPYMGGDILVGAIGVTQSTGFIATFKGGAASLTGSTWTIGFSGAIYGVAPVGSPDVLVSLLELYA